MLILASHRKNLGFSLIELMVAVALFGVLASLAIPAYRDMIQNNQIRNAAESIQTGIQLARAEAVKRNTTVQFILNGTNSAWCVSTGTTCPGTIQNRVVGEGSSTSVTVTPTPAGSLVFNSLGILTSPTPTAGSGFVELGVDHSTTGTGLRNLRVVVGIGGSSKMCDSALASTDVRSCP